ncbi:hypothetical protein ES705_50279 [subsurface metagenome]
MHIKLSERLTKNQLNKLDCLSTINGINFYWLNDTDPEFYAINRDEIVIARFEFVQVDELQFAHMHVSQEYQNQGIGKEIMRHAVEIHGYFLLPSIDPNASYHYEGNGLQFIRSCFEDQILTSPPFEHPDSDDLNYMEG